jgi:hypothetical protein
LKGLKALRRPKQGRYSQKLDDIYLYSDKAFSRADDWQGLNQKGSNSMAFRKTLMQIAKEAKVQSWLKNDEERFRREGIEREAAAQIELRARFKLTWPWDVDYEKDRRGFDPAFNEYPLLIGHPETPGDVAWLLDLSRKLKLPVSCRSGGHSTAGYCVLPGGIVIDMSLFDDVHIDPDRLLGRVGAGVTFRKLNKMLDQYGLHVPGGECEDVCIGGYMQGGGYGLTSRQFGMNCDNVVEFTMLTYDADGAHLVVANATRNPSLFWAVRGGTGNNFGVLLDVTYQLHFLGMLWGFGIKWHDLKDAPAALLEMQNSYMKVGASPKLGHLPVIMVQQKDKSPSLGTYGLYNGTREEGEQAIKALMAVGNPTLVQDMMNSYAVLNQIIIPDPNLPPGTTSFPPEIKQSAYISRPINLQGWTAIVEYFSTRPNNTNAFFIEPYGGAINAGPKTDNAFVHRDVYMNIYVDSFWFGDNERQAAEEWLDGYMRILADYANGQQYQNYPRRGTRGYAEAFWGSSYPKLQQVKFEFDPLNVFKFPMGIDLPNAGSHPVRSSEEAKAFEWHFERFKESRSGSSSFK